MSAAESIVTIVDLHALTVDHRPHKIRALTLEQAMTLLAADLSSYRQLKSAVTEAVIGTLAPIQRRYTTWPAIRGRCGTS